MHVAEKLTAIMSKTVFKTGIRCPSRRRACVRYGTVRRIF